MDLGQRVVQALAVAERLVERRVEPVEEPQLELVGALEQVLQLGERQRDVRRLVPGAAAQAAARPPARPWSRVENHCCAAQWSKKTDRLLVELVRPRREGHEQVLLRAGHGDVEEPRLVLDGAPVAVRVADGGLRNDVEEAKPALPLGREAVRPQARQEDRRPLHALGLVDGRERDGVRRRVADVGVRLRVVAGRLVLEPVRERLVLLSRLGVEVDLLEVGDRLAELAELVEDELAPHRVTGDGLLAQLERLQELQVETLDVVDAPPLAAVEVAAFVQDGERVRPVAAPAGRRFASSQSLRRSAAAIRPAM